MLRIFAQISPKIAAPRREIKGKSTFGITKRLYERGFGMIIKDLKDCGNKTQHRLKELEMSGIFDTAEIDFLRRKAAALRELQRYVQFGNWTRKASREKYLALFSSKFDYKLIAERFNTTRESLEVFAARQNKRLERAIGEALRLIEQDSIEEGLDCFYARTGEFSAAEFDYRVSELLPKTSQKDSFLVSDCAEEVNVLRSLMKSNVRKRLNSADCGKLSYLEFLLNTEEEAFRQQKAELIRKLRQKDSVT